jgi:superfamily II DNA or RNA helicase
LPMAARRLRRLEADLGEPLGFEAAEESVRDRPTAAARGRRFEEAARYLLSSAAGFRFDHVWRWEEWPARAESGFGTQDLGIDLVAERADGSIWAVQVKFRSRPDEVVPWRELATFVGHSARPDLFAHRLVVTNTWSVSPRFEHATAGQSIGWLGRAELLALGLDWRPFLEPRASAQPLRRRPRHHQAIAIAETVAHLADHERGQLLMACGTGKTLTALWIAEARGDDRILVLVPSLSLLRQFRREWLEAADPSGPIYDLCVCSDTTVAGGHVRGYGDDLTERAADLGVPVTTDPETIATFLRGGGRRLVFGTYQSSDRIADAMTHSDVPPFDLIVADEAHRLAAGTDRTFATVLDGSRIRAHRRLFATATPRIVTAAVRQRAANDEVAVASMDDRAIFGAVAHRLSFGQAIAEDLLSDYRVVVLVTEDSEIARLVSERRLVDPSDAGAVTDAATLAAMSGTARAFGQLSLRRVISFHRTISRARSFASSSGLPLSAAQVGLSNVSAVHVSGAMTSGERAERLDMLRDAGDRPRLVANVRCLAEGVDVPALDGLVFVDPRWSPIDIVQAVGRVIRKAPNKSVGTILIPIVAPVDGDPVAMLEASAFEPVWSVVRALRSHDNRLSEELSAARLALGRVGRVERPSFLDDHFTVLDLPLSVDRARFNDAIRIQVVRSGSASFEEGLGHLLAFVELHGHGRVPRSWNDPTGFPLGGWATERRVEYRRRTLPSDRVARLEAVLGWTWDPRGDDFQAGLAELRRFQEQFDNVRVPSGFTTPTGLKLERWLVKRRAQRNRGVLPPESTTALEAIPGWTWDLAEQIFDDCVAAATAYYAQRPGTEVPRGIRIPLGPDLGTWVTRQRSLYAAGKLAPARIARLNAIEGWNWNARATAYTRGLDALRRFSSSHRHSSVPGPFMDEQVFPLGAWVGFRRAEYRSGLLSEARRRELEGFPGWTWRPYERRFERGLAFLIAYARDHGNAHVVQSYRTPDGYPLGSWCNARRLDYRKRRLSEDRVAALEAVTGWAWEPLVDDFPAGLEILRAYVASHGEALVPATHVTVEGFRLGSWVVVRRVQYRSGRLDPDRAASLAVLPGWSWDPRSDGFDVGIAQVRLFVQEHGQCRIPRSHRTPSGFALGMWAGRRRDDYRAGRLDPGKVAELEAIDRWTWDARADQFDLGFEELQRFVTSFGHSRVHLDYQAPGGFKLGSWVNARRLAYRAGRLSNARVLALSTLPGWEWNPGHARAPVTESDAS